MSPIAELTEWINTGSYFIISPSKEYIRYSKSAFTETSLGSCGTETAVKIEELTSPWNVYFII
jgi:hypothetical protein